MRRENKYGTNKTIRYCQRYPQLWLQSYSSELFSLEKKNLWKLMNLLKKHTQSSDYSNKIVIRRNYNFYYYNGYNHILRENPPKHPSFAKRPDFTYQPYVNFIQVNHHIFSLILRNGWRFFTNNINIEHLFDINSSDVPVTLIYFIKRSEHRYSSDWLYAHKHAFGGHFADYNTVCWGDYCPFGPKIRGKHIADSRIKEVLFITEQTNKSEECTNCRCDSWKHPKKSEQSEYKTGRSRIKAQRREKHILTKQAKTS